MVVVVDVDVGTVVVVVVVVVVVEVDVPVPLAAGAAGPEPATARIAVGVVPPPCGGELLATNPVAAEDGPLATGASTGLGGWVPVPTVTALPAFVGASAAGPAAVVGVVPESDSTGPRAESTCCAIGPDPILSPATTESAAAATAPDAMKRFRTKYSFDALICCGTPARRGALGSGCPNDRDVKTSSKVARSFASAHSGFDPPMILHNNRLSGRARTARSPVSEVQTPPHVQPYSGSPDVSTRKRESVWELV